MHMGEQTAMSRQEQNMQLRLGIAVVGFTARSTYN